MNILILNWRDPKHPLAGGAEQSLFEHAKYWKKEGGIITWYASSFKNAKRVDNIEGIKVIRIGSQYTVHLLFMLLWVFGKINRNFDIVIDSFHFVPFFTPLYIKNINKVALVNEVAGSLWFLNIIFPFSWIGYKIEPFFFKIYKNVQFITASISTRDEIVKIGIKENNIKIIPHGVLLPKVLPQDKKELDPTLIYCSRVTNDKGIEDAVKVFSELKSKVKNLNLWIVGKEERRGYLSQVLNKYPSNKDIKYFGFVSDEKKFNLLRKAWVLVHPSRKEGWGLNVIEANSVGTPAVGYDVGGLRDSIKNKETGLLSNIDLHSLSEAVKLLIDNKKMYERLSKNATEWAKEFSWSKSGKESWALIQSLKK